MDFTLSDDHGALRASAADFLRREVDLAPLLVPHATAAAFDRDALWRKVVDLGWPAMAVPESAGGLQMTLLDLVMVVGELGRTLAPVPIFGTLAGSWAVQAAADKAAQDRLLAPVASDGMRLALAIADATGECAANQGMVARAADGGFVLRGTSYFCVDGSEADGLVCSAMLDGVARLFMVDARATGVTTTPVAWRDTTRVVADIALHDARGELLAGSWQDAWPFVRDRLYLLLAAESAAGSRVALDEAVDYARQRPAFGKTIGHFQAIKHQLAEIAGRVELADVGVQYAAWALDSGDAQGSIASAMAQAYASETFRDATYRNIQVFGAIGFTWEMRNHLFYKRARCNAALLGEAARQHEEIVSALEAMHGERLAA